MSCWSVNPKGSAIVRSGWIKGEVEQNGGLELGLSVWESKGGNESNRESQSNMRTQASAPTGTGMI
jgi:hypothetical protein